MYVKIKLQSFLSKQRSHIDLKVNKSNVYPRIGYQGHEGK